MFQEFEGREIRVVTDFMQLTEEQIVQRYKDQWQIEVFFRWITQHLNIPTCLAQRKMRSMGNYSVLS